MANELSVRPANLQALISSPECLAWRRTLMGTVNHPGQPSRRYLSGGLTLTADERIRIEAKVKELRTVCDSDDGGENRKSRLGLVANLLMAYPIANGTQETGRARAEAYLSALDDVPPWAIAAAIKAWHRAECGSKFNYRWAPAPAELREVSIEQIQPAKSTIARLEAVLSALTIERAMDPAPLPQAEASSTGGRVVSIGMKRA